MATVGETGSLRGKAVHFTYRQSTGLLLNGSAG